jgi:acetyltransferase-like isoleucine patch superfamily enzyme
MVAKVQRAIRLTEQLNRLPFDEAAAIRAMWSELTGQPVDPTFSLIPPLYSDHGLNIRVGRNVFINQCCILNDIGGIDIGDDVMIGPRVSLLTSGHPLEPSKRRRQVVAARIVVGRNVWIGAAAVIMHGVTLGADSVVAAGAVVTRNVPAATLVAGVPARVVRSIESEAEHPAGRVASSREQLPPTAARD